MGMLFFISEVMEIHNSYGEVIKNTTNEKQHQLSEVMEMNTIFREVIEKKKKIMHLKILLGQCIL
jgi:hypothetical protein